MGLSGSASGVGWLSTVISELKSRQKSKPVKALLMKLRQENATGSLNKQASCSENGTIASVFEAMITLQIWILAPGKPRTGMDAALKGMSAHSTKSSSHAVSIGRHHAPTLCRSRQRSVSQSVRDFTVSVSGCLCTLLLCKQAFHLSPRFGAYRERSTHGTWSRCTERCEFWQMPRSQMRSACS